VGSEAQSVISADAWDQEDGQLASENRRLRRQLALLTDAATRAENAHRSFQTVELELLGAQTLPELLGCMVSRVREHLALERVSVVLHDPHHELRHLLAHHGIRAQELGGVRLTCDLEGFNPLYARLRRPWLGPYLGCDHRSLFRSLFRDGTDLQSVAILPLRRGGTLVGSLNFGSADGTRYTRHHATDFMDRLGLIGGVCLENAVNRERLVLSGLTDVLTGWHNRRYLERRLPEELARAARYRHPVSCLILDVDHFKRINDVFGHPAGDQVLRDVARRVKGNLRAADLAVRYGGEEFVVVLPETALADAGKLAERVRDAVSARPYPAQGANLVVTVSIGVAQAPVRAGAPEALGASLIREADRALYRAKAAGRDRVVVAGA